MKIKDSFDLPVGAIPELRLSIVPRWPIISMAKKQSVAEHSFNVAMIVKWLWFQGYGVKGIHVAVAVNIALVHDKDELYSGDIPGPMKVRDAKEEQERYQNGRTLDMVIKVADLIEELRFATLYCNDTPAVKRKLLADTSSRLYKALEITEIPIEAAGIILEDVK